MRRKRIILFAASAVCAVCAPAASFAGSAEINLDRDELAAVAEISALNMRGKPDENADIKNVLESGTLLKIEKEDGEWDLVSDGEAEGYVKAEYLDKSEGAVRIAAEKEKDNIKAKARWDGVNVFAAPDAGAKIVRTLSAGENFKVEKDGGHWLTLADENGDSIYVSDEDVEKVIAGSRALPDISEADIPDVQESTPADIPDVQEGLPESMISAGGAEGGQAEEPEAAAQSENEWQESESAQAETEAARQWTEPETRSSEEAPPCPADSTAADPQPSAAVQGDSQDDSQNSARDDRTTPEPEAAAQSGDLEKMAALIYLEAGNQPHEGKVAVGATVMNRMKNGIGSSVDEIIYQPGQYTTVTEDRIQEAKNSGVYDDCLAAAQEAMSGSDPTGGAMFFNTGSGKGQKIGAHQFY